MHRSVSGSESGSTQEHQRNSESESSLGRLSIPGVSVGGGVSVLGSSEGGGSSTSGVAT